MELRSIARMALQTGTAPPAASGALKDVTHGQSGHPSGDISPLCRLVQRVPAGVGQLHLPGCPQHAHDVHRVVDLRNRELLDRSAERGAVTQGGIHALMGAESGSPPGARTQR